MGRSLPESSIVAAAARTSASGLLAISRSIARALSMSSSATEARYASVSSAAVCLSFLVPRRSSSSMGLQLIRPGAPGTGRGASCATESGGTHKPRSMTIAPTRMRFPL